MEKSNTTLTFKSYVSSKLKSLNIKFIIIFSLIFILFSAIPAIYLKVQRETINIRSISSYIENLILTNDRVELQKVLKAISTEQGTNIELVKEGKVFSETGNHDRLDQDFKGPSGLRFDEINFTPKSYILEISLKNNASVFVYCNYLGLINEILSLFLFVIVGVGIFLFVYYKKVNEVILKSLNPLSDLENDISNLLAGRIIQTKAQEISELESIRLTIIKTNNELENAKEVLAIEKAKKLNADAYKKLIHDLHNPVSSLQSTVSAINDPTMDFEAKKEIINMIPSIADQLLSQVVSAKKNLEFDSVNLQKRDVNECLNQCLNLINSNNKTGKEVVSNFLDENLIIPHDPILLQRAVLNLMENGLEFSKGKIELKAIKHKDYVSIIISDDGNGMKREDVPVYFQGRGKSSRAERQAFGLSSANHIARVHGGKLIYAKNDIGGASFELRLNL